MQRVPGGIEAEVSFEEGAGLVSYDPETTEPRIFIRELADKTGFGAQVVGEDGHAGQPSDDARDDATGREPLEGSG